MSLDITPALREVLQNSGNVSCVIDDDFRLLYCNPAWDQFALQNDGEAAFASRVFGTNLFDVIPTPLKRVYDLLFAAARDTRQVRPIEYDCSSPKLNRLYRMEICPLPGRAGFVLVHALRWERPHGPERTSFPPDEGLYLNSQGLITVCAHCRKTKRAEQPETWDWVPEFLTAGAPGMRISHGLCKLCLAYFYPQAYKAKAAAK